MERATSVFSLSLATSTGPSRLHGNPFLMSAYLHIRTAQSQGEGERERERGWGEGTGEGGQIKQCHLHRVPQWCNSHYHLTLWQKRARHSLQQNWPIFFIIISFFVDERIKRPLQVFLWISRAILWQSYYSHCVGLHIWTKLISHLFYWDSGVIFSKAYKRNHYFHFVFFLLFCSFSSPPHSAESPTTIFDSTHQSGGDAGGKRQPHLCGSGLTDAIREVDDGISGADQGRRNADGPKCAGSDQHTGVCQLYVHGHVFSGRDRGNRTGHSKRWEFLCAPIHKGSESLKHIYYD